MGGIPFLLIVLGVACLAALPGPGVCGVSDVSPRDGTDAICVFLDCDSDYCDFDHFRREIPFVDYVRDRKDADVHVLITTRDTAGGGQEFTITLIGQVEFTSLNDSLTYYSRETDTFEEIRAGLTRMIKLGLVRYVSRTSRAQSLDVTYRAPRGSEGTHPGARDPWDYWVFQVSLGGDLSGEEQQRSRSGDLTFLANRTTENWKTRFFASLGYSEDTFDLGDGSEFTSIARDNSGGAFLAKSLSPHWSLGGKMDALNSTYQNYDLALDLGPAIEFNLFPYTESTYRELTFAYYLIWNRYDYSELTIFDKLIETRWSSLLKISYSLRQPFGTVGTSLAASSFLDDFNRHSAELSFWMDIRLVKGFQLGFNSSAERIKDQIYLPRAGATDEEVLLRRRELGTNYRYTVDLSLSYTFGSIFNNVVNPRLE